MNVFEVQRAARARGLEAAAADKRQDWVEAARLHGEASALWGEAEARWACLQTLLLGFAAVCGLAAVIAVVVGAVC